MVCQLCILGKFILVLCVEIKKYRIIGLREENSPSQVKFVKPWVKNYVKNLFQQRPPRQYSRMEFYLRKIYNPEKNFKFSTQTLSVVMICYILLYNMFFYIIFWSSDYLTKVKKVRNAGIRSLQVEILYVVLGSLIAATVLATAVCMISLLLFMENHKDNMLRMFKGDKSFIPKKINVSQFMIGKGLRYSSYHIAYFFWGYILILLFLFVLCFCLSLLSFSKIRHMLLNYLSGTGVIIGVALITRLSLPITSMTIFRDHDYPKHVISINNRNVYLVFSYFWFFLGLPLALTSAIYRVLKLMCLGAVMLPIINYSVMPDGFQQFDQGFISYICYLHVQTAYRNPILRLFCQILHDHATRRNTEQKWIFSAQARARWFLALTLARNPQLASERRPDIRDPRPQLTEYGGRHSDVLIEVHQYGSDNVGLIQDN